MNASGVIPKRCFTAPTAPAHFDEDADAFPSLLEAAGEVVGFPEVVGQGAGREVGGVLMSGLGLGAAPRAGGAAGR